MRTLLISIIMLPLTIVRGLIRFYRSLTWMDIILWAFPLWVLIVMSSCTPLRMIEEQQYISAMYKQCLNDPDCGTDMDFELIDRRIYERLYSCERYHPNDMYARIKHDSITHKQ